MLYIKPLIKNARQIDVISNVVVLIIATATNFRFGLIAFSKMFPKPSIFILNDSKLTPIHYLCFLSSVFDVISMSACGIGILNSIKLSNVFMLSVDLLIVNIVNLFLVILFMVSRKPEQYFEEVEKKHYMEENIHNPTNENLPNEKNFSNANMIAN